MRWITGYCTNVHPGPDLEQTRRNLTEHALAVKQAVSPQQPMGVGLWLSAQAAARMRGQNRVAEFATWLAEVGLVPFTLNGFPFGDFHQPIVKHAVYRPTWCEAARVDYTLDLIELLDRLLPSGMEGSISTLPLDWGTPALSEDRWQAAAQNLRTVAARLERLEQDRGRLIYVCLEPEPGCALQRSEDVTRFFADYLCRGEAAERVLRYLRVCHDVCHSAVMFEDQAAVLDRYRAAGIAVGKVQVSSALVMNWDAIPADTRHSAVAQLHQFVEPRYLHQTVTQTAPGSVPVFFEDLASALTTIGDPLQLQGQWRVHFHVPIYLDRFGCLETSQDHIDDCLQAVRQQPGLTHFEVETYAWKVLPAELQQPRLADGIAREMRWLQERIQPGWGVEC